MEAFGLMYYNARWYDPVLGRFAQADTLVPEPENPLAWDRYVYVMNNPVRYVDPSGHMLWEGEDGGYNYQDKANYDHQWSNEDVRLSWIGPTELSTSEKTGLIFTGVTLVVGFTAAEVSLGILGIAAIELGPLGIAFDTAVIIPTELFLIDTEVAIMNYIYDTVITGTKEGNEVKWFLFSFLNDRWKNQSTEENK
jgi:RHS repeat-associated protein